jgi:hypothetical protein
VKRFVQGTLIVVAALAGIVGLCLLAINLYIQSSGTQALLRDLVSENLGYPVTVFRISFTPWAGFHFEDITVRDPSLSYPVIEAHDLWVQCRYLPLFRRKLIVRRVFLKGGTVRVPIAERPLPTQGDDDQASHAEKTPEPAKNPTAPVLAEPKARQILREETRVNTVARNFLVEIQRFKVQQAYVYFMGPGDLPIASLRNVEGSVEFHKGEYFGKMRIASASISDSVNVEDIASPVKISDGAVDLDNISAQISGGEIRGNFHADLKSSEFPYGVRLEIAGVNLNEIFRRSGGVLDQAHGTLEGNVEIAGFMKAPSRASGGGFLEVKTGYLDQYPVLRELGRWTQIDELQRLDLKQAHSKFSVVGQDIKVDSLKLISKNCQVDLSGTVKSVDKLALNGRLTVSQFLSQKIPNELEDNFAASADGKSRYLDFRVSGSLTRPQTDLFDRIIGDKEKLLRKLLRSNREKRKERLSTGAEQVASPGNR